MHARAPFFATLLALLAAAVVPPAAVAGELIDRAVAGLREDPVYVDPASRQLGAAAAERLRERIRRARAEPLYVAVLRAAALRETRGDGGEVLQALADGLRRPGTYAVVVGSQFRAGSTVLPRGTAAALARQAFRASAARGVAPTLLDFVDRVGRARRDAAGSPGGRDGGDGSRGIGTLILPLLLAAGAGFFLLRRRRRSEAARAEFAEVRGAAEEDLLALADDIRALDLDVEMPGVDPAAKADYATAVRCYERADRDLDRARRPEDLEAVTAAIEEGRFAMVSAKARLEGREPPERRPPCFFDPRHGPSARDVEWAPPGGAPRLVPACAADARAVDEGLEPAAREVMVGGRPTPYWNAPASYGPWAGGFFGGAAGGLLPGLLIGSMLGGGLGLGFPANAEAGADSNLEGGDFGGGDFGGGDFGGGDFGGGDFGGGDFGGGDFGGGDFGGGGE